VTSCDRAADRRRRIVANRAGDFAQAEDWDLIFWQSRTPEERLASLVALRNGVALVEKAKRSVSTPSFRSSPPSATRDTRTTPGSCGR